MKPVITILLFCFSLSAYAQAGDNDRQLYVDQYGWLAVQEMERTGVPASIKLAQAILESRYGTSILAREANNHFGIKCGGSWTGGTYYRKDDDYVLGQLVPSCFRAYSSTQESFVAHSNFLMRNARYASLFALDTDDYKGWARGLKKAGYATARHYHRSLISIIEEMELHKFDQMSSSDFGLLAATPTPSADRPGVLPPNGTPQAPKPDNIDRVEVLVNNDVKYVISRKGETLETLSDKLDIPVKWLLSYNENIDEASESLSAGAMIYIQAKRKNFRGRQKWHEVNSIDNMFSLSQRYGISLNKLYERNQMIPGTEPAVGSRVKIRGGKVRSAPALRPVKGRGQLARTVPPASKPVTQPNQEVKPDVEKGNVAQAMFGNKLPEQETPTDQVSSGAVYHRVTIGDELEKIAKQYNLTVEQLRKWNQLPENPTLMLGMRLRVQ